jgi:hypothetical protein
MKATDGVIALKARDVAALNDCAVQIEKLAALLDVPERCIQRANTVKQLANKKRWIDAFSELGRLQHEVIQYLEGEDDDPAAAAKSRKDDALLIIIGGWLESGRCFTTLILDHYTKDSSNVLREPRLVEMFNDEVKGLKPPYADHALIKAILEFLPGLKQKVSVGLHDPVPEPDVKWMQEHFQKLVIQAAAVETESESKATSSQPVAPAGKQ